LLSNVLSDISNTTAGEIITLMAVDHLSFIGIQVEPLVRQQLQAIAIKLC
jgi:hypothetical protein